MESKLKLILSSKVVFGFSVYLQKVEVFLVLSDLIMTKNKKARGSIGKVFLMIKIGPEFMVHLSTLP
jgi:hypothetical protein